MKISQFAISATGVLYSMATGNLPAVILFGILALVSFQRTMSEVEGGEDQWESHGRKSNTGTEEADQCRRIGGQKLVCDQ